MSSPNTKASILLKDGSRSGASASSRSSDIALFGTTKSAVIGKDNKPVSIMHMVSTEAEPYMRSTCFKNLVRAIKENVDLFDTSDLITCMSNELPINTSAASEGAHEACLPILQEALKINNLQPRFFLNKHGKEIKFDESLVNNRPADLFYVSFDCTINAKSIDNRINQSPLQFNFCLNLPQTSRSIPSPTNNNPAPAPASTPAPTSSISQNIDDILNQNLTPTSLTTKLTELKAKATQLESSFTKPPATTTNPPSHINIANSTTSSINSSSAPSIYTFDSSHNPKMNKLIANSNKIVTSYHGSLDFADDQNTFNSVFGHNPLLLHVSNRKNLRAGDSIASSKEIKQILQNYMDKCKLDVFISLCQDDYVGSNFNADDSKSVQAICKKIQSFKMQYQSPSGIKTIHPNILFEKYLNIIPSLPKDPSTWNFVLCMTYYDALTPDLKNRMTEDKFVMPVVTSLISKSDHITALRKVKEQAAESFRNITNEKSRLQQLLLESNITTASKPNHQGRVHFTNNNYHQPTLQHQPTTTTFQPSHTTAPIFNYQPSSTSQAETTMQRYLPTPTNPQYQSTPAPPDNNMSKPKPPTVIKADGLEYPYNPQNPSQISDYPISFRGCYGCGQPTHFRFKEDCPLRQDRSAKKRFWENLWLHKPWTKRRPDNNTPISNNNHYGPPQQPTPTASSFVYQQPSHPHQSGIGRGVNTTTPAWMTSKSSSNIQQLPNTEPTHTVPSSNNSSYTTEERVTKKGRLFALSASIFNQNSKSIRQMPLDLDNGLPGIAIRFTNDIFFLNHVDTCAAMNTGNLLVHQWIISNHPSIVAEYCQFDDSNPFEPISLKCAIEKDGSNIDNKKELDNCLTAVVRYKTPYSFENGTPVTISYGLGKHVAVNAIIGLPTLRQWGADISLSTSTVIANAIKTNFPIEFAAANAQLPDGITFSSSSFIRPPTPTNLPTQATCANIEAGISNDLLNTSDTVDPPCDTIIETTSNGYLQRTVQLATKTDA